MIIRGSDKNLLSAAILFQYVPRVLRICLSWRKIIRTDNQLSRFTLVKFVLYFFLYIIASHVSWMFNFLVYPSTKMFGMLVWLRSSNLSRLNKALCRSRGQPCTTSLVFLYKGVARNEHLGGPNCNRNILNIILKSIGYKIINFHISSYT